VCVCVCVCVCLSLSITGRIALLLGTQVESRVSPIAVVRFLYQLLTLAV
jgi:hypothetical protein